MHGMVLRQRDVSFTTTSWKQYSYGKGLLQENLDEEIAHKDKEKALP